jgi:hypothetical protein
MVIDGRWYRTIDDQRAQGRGDTDDAVDERVINLHDMAATLAASEHDAGWYWSTEHLSETEHLSGDLHVGWST